MKADQTGTHSEQQRARVGWRNATQTAFSGAKASPCWACAHWTGGATHARALCTLMGCGTGRNASCSRHSGGGRSSV